MDDQSFDPRTWNERASTRASAAQAPAPPLVEARPQPGEPARARPLGMAISVAILLAGAAAAYATRPAPTDAPTGAPIEALNSAEDAAPASASG